MIVIGVGLILASNHIKERLAEAEGEISDAKRKLSQGETLFSLSPISKGIGQAIAGGAEDKIRNAEEEVQYYYRVAATCQGGGIAAIVLGAFIVIFARKKKP